MSALYAIKNAAAHFTIVEKKHRCFRNLQAIRLNKMMSVLKMRAKMTWKRIWMKLTKLVSMLITVPHFVCSYYSSNGIVRNEDHVGGRWCSDRY